MPFGVAATPPRTMRSYESAIALSPDLLSAACAVGLGC
jgi:hypothetical protein